jgi:hypothetical protein
MYDVNPLGPLMHLKELDRQAVRKLRPTRGKKQGAFSVAIVGAAIIALLRRRQTAGIPGTSRHIPSPR